jgi:predicted MFS family arabinose efflux permease
MPPPEPVAASVVASVRQPSLRGLMVVIAAGLVATRLGWPGLIGRLPFGLMLKNQLHLPAQQVAAFWAVATFAWYIKPLVGLVCDAFPLFGTRRRGYLLVGGLGSAATWATFALVPRTYAPLLAVMVGLNLALVFVSTVVGGMLVEAGHRHDASGRLSSLREALQAAMALIAGPLGGWLASRAFGWTIGAGVSITASFVLLVAWLYREGGGARPDTQVWMVARAQLRSIVRSRAMWTTSGLIFLVFLAPGFQTPLLYYQQDVLKFEPQLMGLLETVGGASSLVGALVYGVACRRWSLRTLLIVGVLLNAGSTLFFLGYRSPGSAMVVNAAGGALLMFGMLPLFDLAVRATPKGSESFGYSLMMSVRNFALIGVSEVLGSYLYGSLHWRFESLVWVNALSTAAVLLFVPALPEELLAVREGRIMVGPAA